MPRNRREHMLRVRASASELDTWRTAAAARGLPLSQLLRQLLANVDATHPPPPPPDPALVAQVRRIGNNLNQIARHMHRAPPEARLAPLARLAGIEAAVKKLLTRHRG